MPTDDRHEPMEVARTRSGLTVQQLWLRYVAIGGSSDAFDVDGYLQGLVLLDSFQQDVLAQAVNEALQELHRSLQVPLSATAGDGAVDSDLEQVIDEMLTKLKAQGTAIAPVDRDDQHPVRPPRPRPEE